MFLVVPPNPPNVQNVTHQITGKTEKDTRTQDKYNDISAETVATGSANPAI
jgi:hypothetical protein